jgi:hypothetical protein
MPHDVFISYSKADETWVWDELLPRLEGAGLRVCIDDRDFLIGAPKLVNIERAVDDSRHTLIVLTPEWVQSEWNEFESLLVGSADPSGRKRRMLPLMLRSCQLPGRIAMLDHTDFTRPERREAQFSRLLRQLGAPAGAAPGVQPSPAAVAPPDARDQPQAHPTVVPGASLSFRQVKLKNLQRRHDELVADYEAASNQLSSSVDEVERTRLKRRAKALEQEIQEVESELTSLR